MTLSNILLLVTIIAANAIFAHRIFLIYRLVNLGRGSLGLNEIPRRVKDLLVKGFGQTRVVRVPSGWGHFIIFWGFWVITFGTTEGIVNGLTPTHFTFDFLGPIWVFMNTLQDLLCLLVFVALIVAVYRRLVLKPKRLQMDFSHTLDALIILSLIAIIVITIYGMRVVDPRAGFTPVGNLLRALFVGSDAATIETSTGYMTAYMTFEWIHNLVVLGFLAYVPYSKHLHVVTALPNLFFREPSVRGQIKNLDLEDEDAETFGVNTIQEFTAKELLDVMSCAEAGRCQDSCPAFATGKALNPKEVVLGLKAYLFEQGPALLKDPKAEPTKALFGDTIPEDVLWACTTCRACEEVCPVEIQPMTKLIKIRQARVLMEGDFPEEAQNSLRNIEGQSNPWNLPQGSRGDWCQDLGIKTLAEDPDVEYLFYVGCAGSYDQRYINVSRSLVKILQAADVKFGILGAEECCTGDSAKRIGNEMLAQMLGQQNIETMNNYKVKKVITSCPHCYNSIANEYPALGGEFEVIHHSDLISHLVREGKLTLNKNGQDGSITYHDSCYLGRYNDILEGPRDVIKAVHGDDNFVELPRHGMNSFCCGAGGGRMWMEERIGTQINVDRSREVIASGAKTVATACPFCMTMITDGINKEAKGDDITVKDIAEIVAESLETSA